MRLYYYPDDFFFQPSACCIRLVAEREYAGEVKNSYKVLICSLRFAAVTGGILSILTFLLGGVITKYVMGVELASYALRVLAPAIFLFALTRCTAWILPGTRYDGPDSGVADH